MTTKKSLQKFTTFEQKTDFIFQLNDNLIEKFLEGYFDADGCYKCFFVGSVGFCIGKDFKK
jgi:intein/homing endonuclease